MDYINSTIQIPAGIISPISVLVEFSFSKHERMMLFASALIDESWQPLDECQIIEVETYILSEQGIAAIE